MILCILLIGVVFFNFLFKRAQLIVCVRTITQQDFPEKWVAIVDKVHHFIQSNEINSWYGALQAFYQLCKIYEYKSAKEREPYHKAMAILLPMFLERLVQLNDDPSDLSVLTQKQILKIFFTFTQVAIHIFLQIIKSFIHF